MEWGHLQAMQRLGLSQANNFEVVAASAIYLRKVSGWQNSKSSFFGTLPRIDLVWAWPASQDKSGGVSARDH